MQHVVVLRSETVEWNPCCGCAESGDGGHGWRGIAYLSILIADSLSGSQFFHSLNLSSRGATFNFIFHFSSPLPSFSAHFIFLNSFSTLLSYYSFFFFSPFAFTRLFKGQWPVVDRREDQKFLFN